METEPDEDYVPSEEEDPDFWKPAEPKDPTRAMEYLWYQKHQRTIACPNCDEDMELMTGYKDDGTLEYQVFYCWNCDIGVPPDYEPPEEEDDFDEEDWEETDE
jgi:hypothetical protein